MQLKPLFFGIVCLIASNNSEVLLAHDTNENIAPKTNRTNATDDDIRVLAENVYDLVLQGHSVDEIIAIFCNKPDDQDRIKEFAMHFRSRLNEKYLLKDDALNSFLNKKKPKESSAQKRGWKKIEFLICVSIVAGLCYATYYYYKKNQHTLENTDFLETLPQKILMKSLTWTGKTCIQIGWNAVCSGLSSMVSGK